MGSSDSNVWRPRGNKKQTRRRTNDWFHILFTFRGGVHSVHPDHKLSKRTSGLLMKQAQNIGQRRSRRDKKERQEEVRPADELYKGTVFSVFLCFSTVWHRNTAHTLHTFRATATWVWGSRLLWTDEQQHEFHEHVEERALCNRATA